MPIGYLFTVALAAVCTAVALFPPRPRDSRPFRVSFWLGFMINEIPVVVIAFLTASTLLALSEGDLSSPGGIVGAAVAAVTVLGLVALTRRGLQSASKLRADVARAIGPVSTERHPVRSLLWPFPTRSRRIERLRDIPYGDGPKKRLDLYRSGRGDGPTLVYFHGGAFRSGDKARQARPLLQTLAQRGWVCVGANYPLTPHARYRDQLEAARSVVAWVRSNSSTFGADPDRVFVAGSSAGAHLAATVALTDDAVRGAICLGGYFGPADGDDPESSPAAHMTPSAPPFLMIHGDNDTLTIAEDARVFADTLRRISNNPVVYAELAGGQHSFDVFNSPRMEAVVDVTEAFGAFATDG